MEAKKNNASDIVTIPNILSFARLCMIPLIVWLYCGKEDYLLSGALLVVSGITDLVDGFLARRFGWVSDLGKILDPMADKLTQAAMLICLVLRFPMILLPFGLMVVKELFMTISGSLIIKKTGSVFCAQWHGKAATVLLYATMIFHVFWQDIPMALSLTCILASTAMIAVSFVLYGIHNIGILRQCRKDEKIKKTLKKILLFITNPRLLLCVVIAWLITNGWSYILFGIGTYYGIGWMTAVAGAYIAFLWLPISPEKIVTFAIAIALLRFLFPNDQKTLAVLKDLYEKAKGAIQKKKE